ncbi:MAG TPA: hypothetical protein VGP22_03140, partial [Albitalea sp.]|nr:hypothetical protein [Albitalea sp.]
MLLAWCGFNAFCVCVSATAEVAGSRPGGRVTFFVGSKKVTKERAFTTVSILLVGVDDRSSATVVTPGLVAPLSGSACRR